MDRICFVCLQQDKEMMNSIFEKVDGATTCMEIINWCITYKLICFEEFPKQICIDCKRLALNAFKFKRKCEEAYAQLTGQLCITLTGYRKDVETQTESSLLYFCEFCDKKDLTLKELKTHQLEAHKGNKLKCQYCKKPFIRVFTAAQSRNLCPDCYKVHIEPEGLNKTNEVACSNNFKQQQIDARDELSNLPDIEEVDLKVLTENTFTHDNSNEQNEDLLVYIKQFDSMTDDEDNEPLSVLQQAEKLNNSHEKFQVECELKETNLKHIGAAAKSNEFENETPINQEKNILNKAAKNGNTKTKIRKKKNKEEEKSHRCNICEKKFTTSTYLQRHIIMHAKKRFNCKECSQNFLSREDLREHVKSEGHDKRLLCPECGLRCRTSNILMVHLRRHKGEKPYKCKFCSKGFPRSDDLRLHEKYHTGEKSHFCGTCGKGFQRKYNLKIHLRVHTGEKPYQCPNCPQAFAQGNDLKAHIRRHTGERFRCELCDAAFLQGYQIRQHKLSEHGIRDEPPTQRVAKFISIEAQKQQILENLNKDSL